jgi:hypothetical protein
MFYSRLNWSTLRLTHSARPAVFREETPLKNEMPEQTPVVGDQIRYLHATTGMEVSPMSAFGYLSCGIRINYETYESAS